MCVGLTEAGYVFAPSGASELNRLNEEHGWWKTSPDMTQTGTDSDASSTCCGI